MHVSFIGVSNKGTIAVSVLKQMSANGDFWAIKVTKKSSTIFKLNNTQMRQVSKKPELTDVIQEYLTATDTRYEYYHVPIPEFSVGLLQVERQFPQTPRKMKIGFLYSDGTEQTKSDLLDFIGDQPTTDTYWDFLDALGHEVELSGWKHYRGLCFFFFWSPGFSFRANAFFFKFVLCSVTTCPFFFDASNTLTASLPKKDISHTQGEKCFIHEI